MKRFMIALTLLACIFASASKSAYAETVYIPGELVIYALLVPALPVVAVLGSEDRTLYLGAELGFSQIDFENDGPKWKLGGQTATIHLGFAAPESTGWRIGGSFTYGTYDMRSGYSSPYTIKHDQYLALFNYFYDIVTGHFSITPTFGLGWQRYKQDVKGYSIDGLGTNDIYTDEVSGFACQIGIGVHWALTENNIIEANFRFFAAQNEISRNYTIGYRYVF